MHTLITCGATRNPVDAIRYLSAHSTGRTGLALAGMLEQAGHKVTVLGSGEVVLREPQRGTIEYGSTRDLMAKMEQWVRSHPSSAVVHAAAVGDYEVADAGAIKLPSKQDELLLRLTPTPKIADHVRSWGHSGTYVTFKAAGPGTSDEALISLATRQRARTGCDLVFANVIGRLGERVALVGVESFWYADRATGLAALAATLR